MWKDSNKLIQLWIMQKKKKSWHLVPSLHGKWMGNSGNSDNFIFLGSKIAADGDCSHGMKRHLLLERKAMTILNSVQLFSCEWLSDQWSLLPELAPTHVHGDGDAIQASHPLSSPSPPALNLSQHQGLFKWVSTLRQLAKVLEFQLQHQSFQ